MGGRERLHRPPPDLEGLLVGAQRGEERFLQLLLGLDFGRGQPRCPVPDNPPSGCPACDARRPAAERAVDRSGDQISRSDKLPRSVLRCTSVCTLTAPPHIVSSLNHRLHGKSIGYTVADGIARFSRGGWPSFRRPRGLRPMAHLMTLCSVVAVGLG